MRQETLHNPSHCLERLRQGKIVGAHLFVVVLSHPVTEIRTGLAYGLSETANMAGEAAAE